jgi:hypothetical protein
MSYVEHCKKHGQYHGEICGECFEDLKVENTRLREALKYIAFVGPDQCEDILFGIQNNCLAEVYKAEAYRTLWEEE